MAAELPRCAVCRTRIEPSVPVAFRPDGRVEHVTCPKVLCAVCAGEIIPHQPIRRDGDSMIHGNCWLRRERQGVRVLSGGAGVASLIRERLASGGLPSVAPSKVWGSIDGKSGACAGCGEKLDGGTEYEVEFAGTVSVRFHRVCYGIWEEERLKLKPGIAGGSAASPWTLFFDERVADRALFDDAALEEMLLASAEARAASEAGRARAIQARAQSAGLRAAAHRLHSQSLLLSSSSSAPARPAPVRA